MAQFQIRVRGHRAWPRWQQQVPTAQQRRRGRNFNLSGRVVTFQATGGHVAGFAYAGTSYGDPGSSRSRPANNIPIPGSVTSTSNCHAATNPIPQPRPPSADADSLVLRARSRRTLDLALQKREPGGSAVVRWGPIRASAPCPGPSCGTTGNSGQVAVNADVAGPVVSFPNRCA